MSKKNHKVLPLHLNTNLKQPSNAHTEKTRSINKQVKIIIHTNESSK